MSFELTEGLKKRQKTPPRKSFVSRRMTRYSSWRTYRRVCRCTTFKRDSSRLSECENSCSAEVVFWGGLCGAKESVSCPSVHIVKEPAGPYCLSGCPVT